MAWKVYLEDLIRYGRIGKRMYVMRDEHNGMFSAITSFTLKTYKEYEALSVDDALLTDGHPDNDARGFLQAMSDAAWEIGIKPKQVEGHTDELLKAVRYHLEDMRALALEKK